MSRIRSPFILQTYMPCTLFVFVSWISFVMPSEAGERAGKCPHANYILITMDKSGLDLAGNDRTQTTKHKAAKGV